jgi:hypothetical protein
VISNSKKVLSTIHKGGSLDWSGVKIPGKLNSEIKQFAGKDAWDGWVPENGMVGQIMHSWDKIHLLLVEKGTTSAIPKYVVIREEGITFVAAKEMRKVINAKKTFSSINQGTALDGWPSKEIKKAAGKDAWGDWKLVDGMEAEVVHSWGTSKHLLLVEGRYIVVGEEALEGDPKPKKAKKAKKPKAEEPKWEWAETKVNYTLLSYTPLILSYTLSYSLSYALSHTLLSYTLSYTL